jgi:hypothetical protein
MTSPDGDTRVWHASRWRAILMLVVGAAFLAGALFALLEDIEPVTEVDELTDLPAVQRLTGVLFACIGLWMLIVGALALSIPLIVARGNELVVLTKLGRRRILAEDITELRPIPRGRMTFGLEIRSRGSRRCLPALRPRASDWESLRHELDEWRSSVRRG